MLSWKWSSKLDCAAVLFRKWYWNNVHSPGTYRLHVPVELNFGIPRTLCNIIMSNGVNFYHYYLGTGQIYDGLMIIYFFRLLGNRCLTCGTKYAQFPWKSSIYWFTLLQRIKWFKVVQLKCCYVYNSNMLQTWDMLIN